MDTSLVSNSKEAEDERNVAVFDQMKSDCLQKYDVHRRMSECAAITGWIGVAATTRLLFHRVIRYDFMLSLGVFGSGLVFVGRSFAYSDRHRCASIDYNYQWWMIERTIMFDKLDNARFNQITRDIKDLDERSPVLFAWMKRLA